MARASRTSAIHFAGLISLAVACFRAFMSPAFTVTPRAGRAAASLVTTNLQKENGASLSEVAQNTPSFEAEAISAIEACMMDGTSVESLAKLDVKLRSLEEQLASAIEQQAHKLHVTGAAAAEDGDELAHLVGVRQRLQTLRGQMEALQGVVAYVLYNPQDESVNRQLVQVAADALALGGNRGQALAAAA